MSSILALRLSLPRSRFCCGEAIPLTITLDNGTAAPVAVPVPFAPSRPELRFSLQVFGQPGCLWLGPELPLAGAMVRLPAGDFHVTELSLADWYDFEPGSYTLEVAWMVASGLTLTASIELDLVALQAMAMALAPAAVDDDAFTLQTVTVMAAPGLGVLSERRFFADVDDESLLRPSSAVVRWVDDGPIGAPIEVRAGTASQAWVVAASDHGLRARPGYGVRGAAAVAWPADLAVEVIAPAIETTTGELLVFSLRGAAGARRLVQTRFGLPVTELEPASGPDDWDDEILVPGPVTENDVCQVDGGACSATLVALAADEYRVLALSATAQGGALLHARLSHGRMPGFSRFELPGVPLPHARPSAYVDAAGHTVVALLLTQHTADGLQVVAARVDLDDGVNLQCSVLTLGRLPAAPKEGAITFSRRLDERAYFRCVVLCLNGSAWLGDSTGQWQDLGLRDDWLVPLVLTTQRDHAHIGVRTAQGPMLVRLVPIVDPAA